MTILVVEDNQLNREVLTRRLTRKGFEILQAVDGIEGVRMAREFQPALILMDMSLPGMDGWQATRILKSDAATVHMPVIALTAHAMAGDFEKAMEAGCDDYDTKPVDMPRLLGKIERLLAAKVNG
jgi:two-component system cell cycle response regulator DivK